jgi:hypothetical protein
MFKPGLPRARTIGRRGRGVAFKWILLDNRLYCTGRSGIFQIDRTLRGDTLREFLLNSR